MNNRNEKYEYNSKVVKAVLQNQSKETLIHRANIAAVNYAVSWKHSHYRSMALLYTIIIDLMEVLTERYGEGSIVNVAGVAVDLYKEYKAN